LAVGGVGFTAFYPGGYVVAFHYFDCKMIFADGANAFLPFVGFAFVVVGEGSDV